MTGVAGLIDDLIVWLVEAGVPGADPETVISSLNLTWLLHCYEEATGRPAPLSAAQLTAATTVSTLAGMLDAARPRPVP